MDLEEIGIDTRNCMDPTEDSNYWIALVHAALHLQITGSIELV